MNWSPNSPWLRFALWLNREGQDNHLKAAAIALAMLLPIVWILTAIGGPLP